MRKIILCFLSLSSLIANGQAEKPETIPGKLEQKYCKARIDGMSPNKILSIGWDREFAQDLKSSPLGSYQDDEAVQYTEKYSFKKVSGARFSLKLPLINKPKRVWLIGFNYLEANLEVIPDKTEKISNSLNSSFGGELNKLRSTGMNTSFFQPLSAKTFVTFLASVDLNGDAGLKNIGPLKYAKLTMAALYGKRPHDRKNWAIGLSRGYQGGIATILPLIMYNYTAPNMKWGLEFLIPTRAWYRYNFNKNNLLRAGFELEGASYRLLNTNSSLNHMELRKGQLRLKLEYQRKIYGPVWASVQTGYANILNYNLDYLGSDKNDFHRGIFGKDKYALLNKLSNFMFINFSLNVVTL